MFSFYFYSNECDGAASIGSSRSGTTDRIDQQSATGADNKSTVGDKERGVVINETPITASTTTEIAHLAEQLDSISNDEEGGEGGGETTLNSITGGLQVNSLIYIPRILCDKLFSF